MGPWKRRGPTHLQPLGDVRANPKLLRRPRRSSVYALGAAVRWSKHQSGTAESAVRHQSAAISGSQQTSERPKPHVGACSRHAHEQLAHRTTSHGEHCWRTSPYAERPVEVTTQITARTEEAARGDVLQPSRAPRDETAQPSRVSGTRRRVEDAARVGGRLRQGATTAAARWQNGASLGDCFPDEAERKAAPACAAESGTVGGIRQWLLCGRAHNATRFGRPPVTELGPIKCASDGC